MIKSSSTRVACACLALSLSSFLPLAAAEIPVTSDVLARRGNAEITKQEVDTRMLEVPEQQRAGFIDSPERIDGMLNQMMLVEQMAAEARKLKLDATEEFKQLRKMEEERQLALAYQQYLYAHAPRFDAETLAAEAFAASPSSFSIGDLIDVRHILIKTECRSPQAARELAEELRGRALKGESVAELARKYSEDDGSAANGGLYENVPRGRMVKSFEDVAFSMFTPNELSGVVETPYGYHVIEMVKHRVGKPAQFDDIKEGLAAQMRQRHQARYVKDQSDRLLNLPIEGNPDGLQALRSRYGNAEINTAEQSNPAPIKRPQNKSSEPLAEDVAP